MKDTVTLKEYFETQITAMKVGTELASKNLDYRLERMNQFREQLSEQTKTYITRTEYDGKHESLQRQIDSASRLIYMGLGVIITLEFIIRYFFR